MEKQKRYNQCVKTCVCGECPQVDLCRAWASFVDKHDKRKGYAHFDQHVSLGMERVRNYVMDEKKVISLVFKN